MTYIESDESFKIINLIRLNGTDTPYQNKNYLKYSH